MSRFTLPPRLRNALTAITVAATLAVGALIGWGYFTGTIYIPAAERAAVLP